MTEDRYLTQLKKLVLNTIDTTKYAVFLFGGRTRGRTGKVVDVDIGLLGEKPIPLDTLVQLYSAVDESTIPYKVDFVDFLRVDDDFRKISLEKIEIWNQPPTIKIN